MENETNIVDRLRGKDKSAFELVFKEYFHIMKLYAARFMETIEEAEEITQDVFVKFWEKCDSLSPESSIKSYLYRSIHNSCLNALKHEKVKDAYREHVIKFLESSTVTEEEIDQDNLRERISSEIDRLPPRCSQIFKLSRYDGLKYHEIAEHLDISVKTVEVQMGKALRVLREELKDLKR